MCRSVWLVRCAAALTLASAVVLQADLLPTPGVDELCARAELVIEGEHLGNDRVKIARVYKSSDRLEGNAAEIVVQHVDKHVRVPWPDFIFTLSPVAITSFAVAL